MSIVLKVLCRLTETFFLPRWAAAISQIFFMCATSRSSLSFCVVSSFVNEMRCALLESKVEVFCDKFRSRLK